MGTGCMASAKSYKFTHDRLSLCLGLLVLWTFDIKGGIFYLLSRAEIYVIQDVIAK